MSEAGKAVFLSYASQDAEAAKRICDALRAAGVEVWFDQSELVGGDQWDAKIRGQIGSCALFVPIISAHTQARLEGYFRLEWKLAAQRTHTMADEKTFLLPILLDGTRDAEAKVPGEFKAVQWTKLPGGETSPAFCARVKRLLNGDAETVGAALRRDGSEKSGPKAPPAGKRQGPSKWWWVPAIFGVTMAMILVLKEGRKDPAPPPAVTPPAATSPALPLSKAGQLLAQARSLYQPWWLASAGDLELAEQLLKDAAALEPANADVAAASAMVAYAFWSIEEDQSDARYEMLRSQAQRALRLAPEADTSKLAQALSLVARPQTKPEGLALLQELAEKNPRDVFVLLQLGVRQSKKETEQALVYLRRVATLAPADANPLFAQALVFWRSDRFAEMIPALDAALALRPDFARAHIEKSEALRNFLGDLEGAKMALEKMPKTVQASEQGATAAVFLWYWCRDPDKCLAALQLTGRDYVRTTVGPLPKALIAGQVHRLAGRLPAAEVEWRNALRLVEQRLAQGGTPDDRLNRAYLLSVLGDPVGGAGELLKYEQLSKLKEGVPDAFSLHTYAALGRHDAVIKFFETMLQRPQGLADWVGDVLYDPEYDATRALPAFQPLIAEARKVLEKNRAQFVGPSLGPDDKSVAVLAFADLSAAHDSEYFSDGISEELLNVLAKVPGLKVSARTSAFYFKGKDVPIPEIAQKLGVAYVVEGSVRRQGDKVRITAQLIKAADGFHVWSDTFTRDLKDIFAVQDEIAGLIASNLELKMGMGEAVPRQAVSPAAYQEYLLGRAAFAKASMADLREAVTHFERAVALEPKYAAAWVQLAGAHTRLGRWGGASTLASWAAARAAIDRAVALEPDAPDALLALGWIQRTGEWDWKGAERTFRRALALQPNQPEILAGAAVLLFNIGQTEEAFRLARQAVQLDPLNAGAQIDLSIMFNENGNWVEAEQAARRALQLAPDGASYHSILGWSLIKQGRYAEAEAAIARDSDVVERPATAGLLALARGQGAKAREMLAELETMARIQGEDIADMQTCKAWLYAGLGDKDRAFAALEKARATRDPSVAWLRNTGDLSPLFTDPRWNTLLHQVGLADEQLK